MEVNIEEKEGTIVVDVEGRIDASTAPKLEEELLNKISQGKKKFLVNFSKTSYVSSGGFRAVLTARWELQKQGGNLALCNLNTNVYKVFKMAGFTSIFKIYPSEEEALGKI